MRSRPPIISGTTSSFHRGTGCTLETGPWPTPGSSNASEFHADASLPLSGYYLHDSTIRSAHDLTGDGQSPPARQAVF